MRGSPETTRAVCVAAAILVWCGVAAAAEPTLTATANAARVRNDAWVAPVRLVDTEWWITVDGRRGAEPLSAIEYQARFVDPEGDDQRPNVGTIDIDPANGDRVQGRIDLVVPTRTDYLRPVRVRLRLRDAGNGTSEWVDVKFPVPATIAPVGEAPAAVAAPVPVVNETREVLGEVETEVEEDASIADVRRALLVQARARGATDVDNLRLLASDGKRSKFGADAVRVVRAEAPIPTAMPPAAPELTPVRDRKVGSITMRHGRY
ncbi:hypothetical protein L6Q96_11340 [Candidatus Binatia bacterium]|nr:hypothetical protein [Candidatus Binatia bacterium]